MKRASTSQQNSKFTNIDYLNRKVKCNYTQDKFEYVIVGYLDFEFFIQENRRVRSQISKRYTFLYNYALLLDYKHLSKEVKSNDQGPYHMYCKIESPKQVKHKRMGSVVQDSINIKLTEIKKDIATSQLKLRGNKQSSIRHSITTIDNQKDSFFKNSLDSRNCLVSTAATFLQKHSRYAYGSEYEGISKIGSIQNQSLIGTSIYENKPSQQSFYSSQKKQRPQTQNKNREEKRSSHLFQYQTEQEQSPVKGLMFSIIENQEQSLHPKIVFNLNKKISKVKESKSIGLNQMKDFSKTVSRATTSLNTSIQSLEQTKRQAVFDHTKTSNKINQIDNFSKSLAVKRKLNGLRNSSLIWDQDNYQLQFHLDNNKVKMQQSKEIDGLSRFKKQNDPKGEFNLSCLIQEVPQYQELRISNIEEQNIRAFKIFEKECSQQLNINKYIQYSGEMIQGLKEGKGGYLDLNGDFYYGQWHKDMRHGYGICFFTDKLIYKGQWQEGQMHGEGIIKYQNGDCLYGTFSQGNLTDCQIQVHYANDDWYIGLIKNEQRNGKGTYLYSKGDIYEGQWQKGMKHGEGELRFKNKSSFKGKFIKDQFFQGIYKDEMQNTFKNLKYEGNSKLDGQFIKGRLFGFGRIEYNNGEVYIGLLKDGKRSGKGKMVYIQFSKEHNCQETAEYDGNWKFNYRHGQGKMVWADNSKFEGEWNMDKRVFGVMHLIDESIYKGGFNEEQFQGKGTLILNDKRIFEGNFDLAKVSKFGKLIYPEGDVYIGEMSDYIKEGVGILKLKDGNRYAGVFNNDKPFGFGQIFYSNGDHYIGEVDNWIKVGKGRIHYKTKNEIYEGDFVNDLKEGCGYLTLSDGRVYCGQFKHDLEHGVGEYLHNKDLKDIQEINLIQHKFAEIQRTIYNGCRQLGFEYSYNLQKIVL